MSKILDDHSRFNNFMIMNGLNQNDQPPVSEYLLERKLARAIQGMLEHEDKADLANHCNVATYHLDWAIEDIINLDRDQVELALDILHDDSFRACMCFLTNKFMFDHLEDTNQENQ